ncbi:nicotinamidase (plasmid) [Borrelia recurrentis]|uniref:nicotinamidase n=1 Tax=Borrelia recurrentis (strain A1) TaxID=412418 RepID=B5RS15_BORRA|nr:nicotinamidase [Borrelia recurrentis]ACH95151.1 pyrazinamidase/nicotinamidase (pncA) [Borrelia recurrentis A1]
MKSTFFHLVLNNSALILVDIQNDFLQSGALPVPDGRDIIPLVNKLQNCFKHVIATKDWHPENHISFLSETNINGWPKHCVQNTWGAAFPKDLDVEKIKAIFLKGQDQNYDSYSGFYDDCNKKNPTGLLKYLKNNEICVVFIAGLALDFCVKETLIDAHNLGFKTYLIIDATKSISDFPELIIIELKKLGILTCFSKDILINCDL